MRKKVIIIESSATAAISFIEKGTYDVVMLPWTPQKIKFKSGGQKYVEYDIMDLGQIREAIGVGLRNVAWNGIFPSKKQKDMPWIVSEWKPPEYYQGCFSMWQHNHTVLRLVISNTPICMDVTIADYGVDYKDGFGNYHYYVEFEEAKAAGFTITTLEPDSFSETERDTDPEPITYRMVEGDTLWSVAQKFLGDGLRKEEIIALNKDVIDAAVHSRNDEDLKSMMVGVVLKIPNEQTEQEDRSGEEVTLNNVLIYPIADARSYSTQRISGTYYLYDGINIDGRYRITESPGNANQKPMSKYVIGYIDAECVQNTR